MQMSVLQASSGEHPPATPSYLWSPAIIRPISTSSLPGGRCFPPASRTKRLIIHYIMVVSVILSPNDIERAV